MKKLLTLLMCLTLVLGLVGCGTKESANEEKGNKHKNNKVSEEEVEDIFKKIENGECKVDNNIFTWLEPTHKQANPYPYDYIYEAYSQDRKEYLDKVGNLLWSPNKDIIVDNIKSVIYNYDTYYSLEEILDKNLEARDTLQIVLDEKELGYEGYDINYIPYNLIFGAKVTEEGYDKLTLKEAIDKNIWVCSEIPWETQWYYENTDLESTLIEERQWQVLKQLIIDWGMPTEVYYDVNESLDALTNHYAELYWDCDGYDVVYYIDKCYGVFEIRDLIIYGDGWAEYEGEPIIKEDSTEHKKLK